MTTEATQACPGCGTSLPVVHPYTTWCHECGWNIVSAARPLPSGRFDRLYEQAGRKAGERLQQERLATSDLTPRLTTISTRLLCR